MPHHQNKTELLKRMGVDPHGGLDASPRNAIGKEIQRRAGYGEVTPDTIAGYLEALRKCGQYALAAATVNLSYSAIRSLRKRDSDFAEEEAQAKALWVIEAIDEPIKKFGLEGVNRIIVDKFGNVHQGEKIIQPQLALAFARKHDREGYGDKQEVEHKVSGGVVIVTAPALTEEQYENRPQPKREFIDAEALPPKGDGATVQQTPEKKP